MLATCAVLLLGGYLLKAQCIAPWDGRQYERLCYNDIQALYGTRGIDQKTFPYVDAGLEGGELRDGGIEYPVLTGVFMWASGLLVDDDASYLKVSALLLAPFGMLTAYLLAQLTLRRALLWAAAPAIVLYAFHNWDLLVVAAAVGAVWFWSKGRPTWAAVLLGIGAAIKMYPIFFLAPLALDRWARRDRAGAVRVIAAGLGAFALINLPFAAANFDGWIATYDFHRLRGADWNSIWVWGWPSLDAAALNRVTGVLTAVSFVVALAIGWWRARRDGSFPFVQVAAAMLAAFLLWNKVHSPQYALWILPFFVVVEVHLLWWVAYSVVDLVVYVGIFRWFYETTAAGVAIDDFTTYKRMLVYGVWGRAALLAVLFALFLRARAARGVSAPVSHPVPMVMTSELEGSASGAAT